MPYFELPRFYRENVGAYLSKEGKSFICLSSTMTGKDGQLKSRIVPTLTNGSIARPQLPRGTDCPGGENGHMEKEQQIIR